LTVTDQFTWVFVIVIFCHLQFLYHFVGLRSFSGKKVPKSDYQSKFSISKKYLNLSVFFSFEEYQFRRRFFVIIIFANFNLWITLFSKIFDGPCEHLWKSNQTIIFILLIFLLESTPCWLTFANLHCALRSHYYLHSHKNKQTQFHEIFCRFVISKFVKLCDEHIKCVVLWDNPFFFLEFFLILTMYYYTFCCRNLYSHSIDFLYLPWQYFAKKK